MPDTGCLLDVWGGKKYWLVVLKKKLQDLKLVSWSKTKRATGCVCVAGAWYWRNNQELLPVTINHHHCTLLAQFDPLFGAAFFAGNSIAMGLFCHFQLSPLNTACSNHI